MAQHGFLAPAAELYLKAAQRYRTDWMLWLHAHRLFTILQSPKNALRVSTCHRALEP